MSRSACSCGPRATASVLVRAPLEAMQDIVFPTFGPGYLDVPRAGPQLRDAAQLWLADNLELYEGERRVPLTIVAVRASIPSDRSFAEYGSALAHLHAAAPAGGTKLAVAAALLDVEFEAPIGVADLVVLDQAVDRAARHARRQRRALLRRERRRARVPDRRRRRRRRARSALAPVAAQVPRARSSSTSSTAPIIFCSCCASSCRFGGNCARSSGSSRRSRPGIR